jgi:chemosensory pili system protein ChpA (sensor histidine kinase/response regulator)
VNHKLSPEIAAAFVEETRSYVEQMQLALRAWAAGEATALEQPRRHVHTIKGAAAMVGTSALAHATLALENALKPLVGAAAQPGDRRAELLRRAFHSLDQYLEGIGEGERRNTALDALVVTSRRLTGEPEAGDAEAVRQVLAKDEASAQPAPVAATQQPGSAPLADPADLSVDLIANFRQEAEELLLLIGRSLRTMENRPGDREVQRALRRGVHSLKGAAQSVGHAAVAELAHGLEDLLNGLIDGSIPHATETSHLIYNAFDTLADLVSGEASDAAGWDRVNRLHAEFASKRPAPAPAEPVEEEADTVPPEFLEVFRPEAEEHLTAIANGLRELQAHPAGKSILQDIRRAVHTLKGAAGVIGLMKVNTLAHQMEDLLEAAWEDSFTLTADHHQLLFATADVLTDLIGEPSKHAEALVRRRQLLARYDAISGKASASPATSNMLRGGLPARPATEHGTIDIALPQATETAAPRTDSAALTSRYVRVPIERLDEMVRLVSELVVSRSTFEQSLDAYRHDVNEMRLTLSRLQRLSTRFDTDFEVQALLGGSFGRVQPGPVAVDKRAEFDSLEFDRYTDLHLVARDLSETTSDIGLGVSQLSHVAGDFESYVNRMGRLTSDVQDRLMRMRMVPLANLATRLHRTVRVTSERLGKHVDLLLDGEDIEMDKTALEELAGPLEHLLRNALDHGIESEGVRRASGKRAGGQIRIRAFYAGTQVMVEVSDDGRGIDHEAIRARAIANGLVSEASAATMTEEETCDLIFEAGFSTASTISEISGRGVGLDVVKSAIERLKGNVKITSQRGEGTTFHLRLPMSLAILRVLMVRSRGTTYAVPLANVSRILRLEAGQLERLGSQQILRVGNQVLPALRLDEALGATPRGEAEAEEVNPRQPVLVIDTGGQHAALLVDELLVAREVVVKTLGSLVRKVRGVTGATILGDGGIVLIVNSSELFETQASVQVTAKRAATVSRVRQIRRLGLDVLVVDDSVSVRRVLINLFRNQGWRPEAARDGMEALEILQSGRKFDAVLLDMEMPRMDGYELLTLLRGQPQFASLPVIMLTSRAAEKHRKKAFELGATEFLVKPYQDEALIAVVHRVVAGNEAMAG